VLRHLIVVLRGIGDSVLADKDGAPAWEVSVRGIGHALVDSASLDIDRELVPVRLVDTLAVLGPWWVARVPPMPAGAYRLDVEVKDAWCGASGFASTPLAVVESPPDAEERP
jgi:hypothetical protein